MPDVVSFYKKTRIKLSSYPSALKEVKIQKHAGPLSKKREWKTLSTPQMSTVVII